MLKREAKEITGGLSSPSKMPGYAYNLPATRCLTGAKLVKVPGSVCSGCYALKGRYRFTNVKDALARRLKSIGDPRWIHAMVVLITGERWFRWHDSGDIQSTAHLLSIFEVCKQTPLTSHWLPTRERKFFKNMDPETVPKNLIIRQSSHMINQAPVKSWPWSSTVMDDNSYTCPASKQGNQCKSCRQCWDRKISNISYGKH